MFFIASKVLAFVIKPLTWLLALLVWAWLTRKEGRRKRLVVTALILTLFFSNRALFEGIIRWWEPQPRAITSLTQTYDIGILLGGYSNPFGLPDGGTYHLSWRGNRLIHTLELYQRGVIKKILLSGGSGQLIGKKDAEATYVAPFLERMGVPAEDIILEDTSRNTWENAKNTAVILQRDYPGATCLLLTSAWHMPRASACFRKAGLSIDNYPIDYFSETGRHWAEWAFLPDPQGFAKWEALIKECIGIIAYRIKGYN